ncbi:MAG TPA: SDR family oxidoreductase [Thermoanaerobaculia bacterium]|nr:SDR family oxidoreductase [Thermoanaerobaculia bacterium]
MKLQLKKLADQVMVITGASSGIGLVTAKQAAAAGARVVLAARNEDELAAATQEIRQNGGQALHVRADVTDPAQVEEIAEAAIRAFGRIDTWVNNAGVAMYGRLTDVALEDARRLFDVLFWGVVHGSRTAVAHMSHDGGALINVASIVADRAVPLQGIYSAAKHAVKAFTETLRMELEEEGTPISVSLIKPSSIDTPLFDKARTLLEFEPRPVPPVYAPEVVAETILECAQRPIRDVIPGGMGKVLSTSGRIAPRLTDRYMERTLFRQQRTDEPAGGRPDNLFTPVEQDGGERGRNYKGRTTERSLYTKASLHPGAAALSALGLGAMLLAGSRVLKARRRRAARWEEEGGLVLPKDL